MKKDDISSLAHSKWNCKYHVVFVSYSYYFETKMFMDGSTKFKYN